MAFLSRWLIVPLALGAAAAAPGQYLPPGPQTNGCPLLAIEARIDTISPKGEMVMTDLKNGELVVARITDETHYRIQGYSPKQIKEAPSVTFPQGTTAKFLICSMNGDVVDMKVAGEEDELSRKAQKKRKAKKKKREKKDSDEGKAP
jgi:hypothetical protein